MRRVSRMATVATAIMCGFAAVAMSDQVTFSDSTFNGSDWSVTAVPTGNGGTVVFGQQNDGANPYWHYTHTVNQPGPLWYEYSYIGVFYFRDSAVFTPSVQGAITSISFSEDTFNTIGIGEGLALLQNGVLYAGGYSVNGGGWATHGASSLHAVDFANYWGGGTPPDFSVTGAPITFGFYRANSADAGRNGYQVSGGTDNWSVTVDYQPITAVPLPSAAWAGLALMTIGVIRRRKWSPCT